MATIYNFPIIYWGEDNSTQVEFKITTLMPKGTATTAMCAVVQNQSILMVKPPRGWGLPGGHIEQRETPEQCVLRECIEEASVEVTNLRLIGYWQTTKLKQLPSNAQYPDNGYQLLYMADIKEVLPFKVTHESGAREFVPFDNVAVYHPKFNDFSEILHYIKDVS